MIAYKRVSFLGLRKKERKEKKRGEGKKKDIRGIVS